MSATVTELGELFISQIAAGDIVLTNWFADKIVISYVDDVNPLVSPVRNQLLPAEILYEAPIDRSGLNGDSVAVFNALLRSDVGDFSFNWLGLYNSEHDVLIAVAYEPTQQKWKTDGQRLGNVLNKAFALKIANAGAVTGITVDVESWQVDYHASVMQALEASQAAEHNSEQALEAATTAEQNSSSALQVAQTAKQNSTTAIDTANSANSAASSAEQKAAQAEQNANNAATAASNSADSASAAETAASNAATSANTAAAAASNSAASASSAADSASNAEQAATDAQTALANAPSQVGAWYAQVALGDVGSLAFAQVLASGPATMTYGETINGVLLKTANAYGSIEGPESILSGTWRCLGMTSSRGNERDERATTLFIKIGM